MDAARLEFQYIESVNLDNKAFSERFVWNINDLNQELASLTEILESIKAIGDLYVPDSYETKLRKKMQDRADYLSIVIQDITEDAERVLDGEIQRLKKDVDVVQFKSTNRTEIPINFRRLLLNLPRDDKSPLLRPKRVVFDLYKLQTRLWTYQPPGAEKWDNLTAITMRSILSSKRVVLEHKITENNWASLLESIEIKFRKAQATPGDAVGTIAGQSIGEPATQMVNFFNPMFFLTCLDLEHGKRFVIECFLTIHSFTIPDNQRKM